MLDASVSLLDDYLPEGFTREDREAQPDFYTLAYLGMKIPRLRARYVDLCGAWSLDQACISEACALLQDAQDEDAAVASWPYQKPHRMPHESYPLLPGKDEVGSDVYPSRIDLYQHGIHAAMCNSWRLARVDFLAIIAQISSFLASKTLVMKNIKDLRIIHDQAEDRIQELVDDCCASIPYILNPHHTEDMLEYYPHAPGDANFDCVSEPDLVASMWQLLPTLVGFSQVYCIPRSQKRWLQQYMTTLSRNPRQDMERAMALKLAKEFDAKSGSFVPSSPKVGFPAADVGDFSEQKQL